MYKIFFLFVMFTSLWSSDKPIECQQQNILAKYTGYYTNTALWNNLPKLRQWPLARGQWHGDIASFNITKESEHNEIKDADIYESGEIFAYDNWHEGSIQSVCSAILKNKLWIFNKNNHKWEGPFIRVGKALDENTIYFNRLFQNKCYKDELNQKWCFRNSEIQIDNKKFKVELMLDTVESPLYGNALRLEEDRSRLWMFVPYKNGWKVFQDTFITDENHKVINPLTDKPWHILK